MLWTSFALLGFAHFVFADARAAWGLRELRTLRASGPRSSLIVQDTGKGEQTLRVCNAFAFAAPLEITHVRSNKHLGSLAYKDCKDYMLELEEDDQLDFKAAGSDVGTFAVSELPRTSRILLLTVQKRAGPAMGATFTSHAFAEERAGTAQVAVIDTYSGANKKPDKVTIYDAAEPNVTLRKSEELPLNAVMSINPGYYQVSLKTAGPPLPAGDDTSATFDAEGETSYVVLRVGHGSVPQENATSFPEEVVVFPQTGGARSAAALGLGLLLAGFLQLFPL